MSLGACGSAGGKVQDRHVVFLGQGVDRGEQTREVRLGVDILLAVGGEQHVALGLQAELGEDVGGLDLLQVGTQHTLCPKGEPVT